MTEHFDIRTAPFTRWGITNEIDEPAHGFYARLVGLQGHTNVMTYSDWIDVRARNINPESLLDVVCKLPLSQERKERLRFSTPFREGAEIHLAGETFRVSDMSFTTRRWCPGCIQENAYHRAWWDILAIAECPYHREKIISKCAAGKPVRWWWPDFKLSPDGGYLGRPAFRHGLDRGFASYILGRLRFSEQFAAPLLDDAKLGAVIEACEIVGRLISQPWSQSLPILSEEMAAAGFDALKGDGAHLVEVLRAWLRDWAPEEVRRRGYTIVFEWANRQRATLSDPVLAAMLQKAFRKALAMEARGEATRMTSDEFLGDEIGLTALAEKLGVSRRGLPDVADALGLLPERDWYRAPVKFDPTEADVIGHHVRQMLTRVEVATLLGMASEDVQPLVDAGFLRVFTNLTNERGRGVRFLRSDVDAVLTAIQRTASSTSMGRPVTFFTYAKHSGVRRGDLAVSAVRGEIVYVLHPTEKPGFRGIDILTDSKSFSK